MSSSTRTAVDDPSAEALAFAEKGFVLVRSLVPADVCDAVAAEVRGQLDPVLAPAEFEADVGYPGAPQSREARGGGTPRRLLSAYARFPSLRAVVTGQPMAQRLRAVMGTRRVLMSQCHHNCVMTKSPDFSSVTLWHQDIRYWSFQRPELVSAWLALGDETADNGALRLIPGSHRQVFDTERLDEARFLRPELPENQALIDAAESVTLAPGDVLLFHCRTFHAAGRNVTDQVKLSAVFTYHAWDNLPAPGTRSARYESIPLEGDV